MSAYVNFTIELGGGILTHEVNLPARDIFKAIKMARKTRGKDKRFQNVTAYEESPESFLKRHPNLGRVT